MPELAPGLVGESNAIVTPELTAASYGSGLVPAFATPAMVGLMESAASTAVQPALQPGQSTVGVALNIKHLAATPVGMRVRATARLVSVEGRKLTFDVEAFDDVEKIGEGSHVRMVVDEARFKSRFELKMAQVK